MAGATTFALNFADVLNLLSQLGIAAILVLVWRLFGTVKQYYDIREEAIQKRVEIETVNLSSTISVLEARLSQKDEHISQLRSIIEANQFKNNVIINSFIEIGIHRLDSNQRKELEKIVTEQEELRIAGLETIETLNHLVKVNLEIRNPQKAILLQKKIIQKDGGIPNYYALARILHSLGMYNDEQDVLRTILSIDPNNDVAHYGLGAVNEMLGSATTDSSARKMHDEEALDCFRKAIGLNNDYVLPKIGEAMVLLRNNKGREALDKIKKVEDMEKKDILVDKDYYGLACFYTALSDFSSALKHLASSFEKALPSKRIDLVTTAKHDPDLEPLRKTDEFKKLVDRYPESYSLT